MHKDTILIVEDDPDIVSAVQKYLHAAGFNTHAFSEGNGVVQWVKENTVKLILLDIMLPGKDGLSLCREIRQFSNLPIIMMTAKVDEVHRLIGLDSGADDYVCKPFSVKELVARVKAILRRIQLNTSSKATTLELNAEQLTVGVEGRCRELTVVEFSLLKLMYDHPGRIYSRQQIMDLVYSDYRVISDRTVDSHVRNLRKKLISLDLSKDTIHSVYGAGYKYDPLPNPSKPN